jgi:hypothetical protein
MASEESKKLMMLFIIIVLAIAILLFDLKAGIYKSESRLVNMKTIDEKIKWSLISRWGSRF